MDNSNGDVGINNVFVPECEKEVELEQIKKNVNDKVDELLERVRALPNNENLIRTLEAVKARRAQLQIPKQPIPEASAQNSRIEEYGWLAVGCACGIITAIACYKFLKNRSFASFL